MNKHNPDFKDNLNLSEQKPQHLNADFSPQSELKNKTIHQFSLDLITNNAYRLMNLYSESNFLAIENLKKSLDENSTDIFIPELLELESINVNNATLLNLIKNIQDPYFRLINKVFWFSGVDSQFITINPDNIDQLISKINTSIDEFSIHDATLLNLMKAILYDPQLKNEIQWQQAIYDWSKLLESTEYWNCVLENDLNSGFKQKINNIDVNKVKKNGLSILFQTIADAALNSIDTDYELSMRVLRLFENCYVNQLIKFEPFYNYTSSIISKFEKKLENDFNTLKNKLSLISELDTPDTTIIETCNEVLSQVELIIDAILIPVIIKFSDQHNRDCSRIKETIADLIIHLASIYLQKSNTAIAEELIKKADKLTTNPRHKEQIDKLASAIGISLRNQKYKPRVDLSNKKKIKKTYDYTKEDPYFEEFYKIVTTFNWGAFAFTWIWGIFNKTYTPLKLFLSFILFNIVVTILFSWVWILPDVDPSPYFKTMYLGFQILLMLLCGMRGNDWALSTKKWPDVEKYKKIQKIWAIAGEVFVGLSVPFYAYFIYDQILPLLDFFWHGLSK